MSSDLGQHAAWIAEYVELGFDEIYLHHVGQEQRGFLDAFGEHVLPQLGVTAPAPAVALMRITDTSDLWWKNAVVYCLDVETFMDWNGDGIGDFAGPRPADRPPRRPRRHLPVADALLSDRRARRRLRHHRLLRRRPAAGHARRPGRGHPDGERPRHAGDRRPRRQPHLAQAPVVPVGGGAARTRRTATSTSGAPTRRRTPRRRSSSPTRRRASGRSRSRRGSGTCTASTRSSPTSTSPTRGSATRSPRPWASGCSSGLSGFRVDAVPFLLETDGRGRPTRFPDPHAVPAVAARAGRPALRQRRSCSARSTCRTRASWSSSAAPTATS